MFADFIKATSFMSLNNTKDKSIDFKTLLYLFIKRFFDIILSFLGIIFLLPLWLVIAVLIKLDSKGSVFYFQTRVGKNNKEFKIIKFRSMIKNADKTGKYITTKDDKRITKLGYYLRKFKIDELPQLLNVLKGDMSFVGPRPEVPKYVYKYPAYKMVLVVKPGITDYASIKYRNENEMLFNAKVKGIDISKYYSEIILMDKICLNLEYVKERNIISDLRIIFKTIFLIFKDFYSFIIKSNKKEK